MIILPTSSRDASRTVSDLTIRTKVTVGSLNSILGNTHDHTITPHAR